MNFLPYSSPPLPSSHDKGTDDRLRFSTIDPNLVPGPNLYPSAFSYILLKTSISQVLYEGLIYTNPR